MSWIGPQEDMVCDGCTVKVVSSRTSRHLTIQEAKRLSWTVVEEGTIGGGHMSLHLCPDCARVPRPPKVDRLEGEVPLF